MAESPKGELFFDVDKFFGHFVSVPVFVGVGVDLFKSCGYGVIRIVGLAEIAVDTRFRDGESLTVEVKQEFFVDTWGVEGGGKFGVNFGVVAKD